MPDAPPFHGRRIAVIGLGYVGLPVAVAFARAGFPVCGFDIDPARIAELRAGRDRTREVEVADLSHEALAFTSEPGDLAGSDVFIVTVPTPIDEARRPDLRALGAAARTVGEWMRPGAIVVFESTVYPGATEEACVPILEAVSGLRLGQDFGVGYSPERINPGDGLHRFETITKVVSGSDPATRDALAALYGTVVAAGIHVAPSIRVAEAAKVIENTQRDLNIALMNELSEIFDRLDIDTQAVLAAAGTKWNFLPFHPGLVGGHCIGIDPYYLTYRSQAAGYDPQVILAGRRINDAVPERIARECLRLLALRGEGKRVAVLGLTFKEDVPDLRNSKVADIVRALSGCGAHVSVADPLAEKADAIREYGIDLMSLDAIGPVDAAILAVPHADYVAAGWGLFGPLLGEGGVVMDVRAVLDPDSAPPGITLWQM